MEIGWANIKRKNASSGIFSSVTFTLKRGTDFAHLKHIWVVGNLNYGMSEICSIFQLYHNSNFLLLKYASNMPNVCCALGWLASGYENLATKIWPRQHLHSDTYIDWKKVFCSLCLPFCNSTKINLIQAVRLLTWKCLSGLQVATCYF